MADLSRFCCLNPDCHRYGQRGQGNVAVRARYGDDDRLLLYCKACKVRTLRQKVGPRRYRQRTPAMAAGLADHVWSLREWISFPACQQA